MLIMEKEDSKEWKWSDSVMGSLTQDPRVREADMMCWSRDTLGHKHILRGMGDLGVINIRSRHGHQATKSTLGKYQDEQ